MEIQIISFDQMAPEQQRRYNRHIVKVNSYIERYNRRPEWLNRLLKFLHLI